MKENIQAAVHQPWLNMKAVTILRGLCLDRGPGEWGKDLKGAA